MLEVGVVQMFGKNFMKVCCMAKDCYRNYSVTSRNLEGRLNIDFFFSTEGTFKMSEKQ